MSSSRSKNLTCVQKGSGSTSTTFAGTLSYIREYRPKLAILENVVDLLQEHLVSKVSQLHLPVQIHVSVITQQASFINFQIAFSRKLAVKSHREGVESRVE
eukprot:2041684-Amphidinium_carterae.2